MDALIFFSFGFLYAVVRDSKIIGWLFHTALTRLSAEDALSWRDDSASPAPNAPSPPSVSAPHAWLTRVAQEEEERKRRGMVMEMEMEEEEEEEEEEELGGQKGAASAEELEDEGKKDMQEKLSKLFDRPTDPWASTGASKTREKV